MLAIFGTSGLLHRGPIEDLRRVLPALRATPARALHVELDRPDFRDSTYRLSAASDEEAGTAPRARTASVAVHVYGEVQNPPAARRPLERVQDVMTAEVVTLGADLTLLMAWQQLSARGVAQAPVLDGAQRLVGLLTRSELMSAQRLPRPDESALVWRAFLQQPVSAVMLTPVPAVTADTALRRLAALLLATGLPGVPVVDDAGSLCGFVSRTDVLKAVVHDPPLDLWAG
jgi:CBS domain-containing protein